MSKLSIARHKSSAPHGVKRDIFKTAIKSSIFQSHQSNAEALDICSLPRPDGILYTFIPTSYCGFPSDALETLPPRTLPHYPLPTFRPFFQLPVAFLRLSARICSVRQAFRVLGSYMAALITPSFSPSQLSHSNGVGPTLFVFLADAFYLNGLRWCVCVL